MMKDRLWAPWRMEYILAPKDSSDCILCGKVAAADDYDALIAYRGEGAFVMMNLYPYNNGHIMVSPYEHAADLDALPLPVQTEMWDLANRAMRIMRVEMRAQGFNVGMNIGSAAGAGIEEHLHLHVVPRWIGDTNYMPVIGGTKVQVQSLQATCQMLAEGLTRQDQT